MPQKISCSNSCCRHHQEGNVCGTAAEIGPGARCQTFEKGPAYYFGLVWAALENKNFIDAMELTTDLKIGLYCVMTVYHLGFSTLEWGTCRIYALKAGENGPMLKTAEITALSADEDAVKRITEELTSGYLTDKAASRPQRLKVSQPFGWLSPTGVFTEGDFGKHDAAAREIIREKGFWAEFRSWRAMHQGTCRDFLSEVKGYCLIHNPSGVGGYIVSAIKPLTRKQRDFLYGYFMDLGDRFRAEQYYADQESEVCCDVQTE